MTLSDSFRSPLPWEGSSLDRLARLLEASEDRDNPRPGELQELLAGVRTIAVVGLSRFPEKVARTIPSYLLHRGFEVIPVNPHAERILGRKAFDHLDALDGPVDLVLVFRPSREAAEVIRAAARRPERPAIWLQEGILAEEAAREARAAGLLVVQDLCVYTVHRAMSDAPEALEGPVP